MTVGNLDFVTVLVLIMCAMVLGQAIFTVLVLRKAEKRLHEADRLLSRTSTKVLEKLAVARNLLEDLKGLHETLPLVEKEIFSLLDSAHRGTEKVSSISARGIQIAMAKVEDADRRSEYALAQFTRQTTRLRKGVRYPVIHLSALLKGVLAGIETLWMNREEEPQKGLHEEEGFI